MARLPTTSITATKLAAFTIVSAKAQAMLWIDVAPADAVSASAGRRTRTKTITRSSTISQPTAM